ncbi:MAG: rhomboid family intramembrane serine protease [Planctomycetota bacterium]
MSGIPTGPGSPSQWSFNTWLIVANIAVFVLGSFIGAGVQTTFKVPTKAQYFIAGVEPTAEFAVTDTYQRVADQDGIPRYGRVIVAPETREPLGISMVVEDEDPFVAWGHFSTGLGFFQFEIWRLVTFQFLHAGIFHLLFNMIVLFFFGPIVERHLRSRMLYAAFYLTCGIFGALLYLLFNLLGYLGVPLPGALDVELYTKLIGASGGCFGVIFAAAFLEPNARVLLFGVLPMRLRTLAYATFGLALFNLVTGGDNAGGDAAHVGGALAGAYFIRNPKHLLDFFDGLLPTGKKKGTSLKAKKQKPPGAKKSPGGISERDLKREDELLAKVGTQGMQSLTESEMQFLNEIREKRLSAERK